MKTLNKSSKWLNNVKTEWLVNGTTLKITINAAKSKLNNDNSTLVLATSNHYHLTHLYDMHTLSYKARETATVILAPMYGGIWTLCISLTGTTIYSYFTKNVISECTLKQINRTGLNGAT